MHYSSSQYLLFENLELYTQDTASEDLLRPSATLLADTRFSRSNGTPGGNRLQYLVEGYVEESRTNRGNTSKQMFQQSENGNLHVKSTSTFRRVVPQDKW